MYSVREMKYEDCSYIYDIETRTKVSDWTMSTIEDLLKYNYRYFYVLLDDNDIIGFAGISVVMEEGDIEDIAILPEYQGQHLSRLLMNVILKKARDLNVHKLTLEVRASNEKAISLYTQYGFKQIAIRKGYYKNPCEDAIIMQNNELFTTIKSHLGDI